MAKLRVTLVKSLIGRPGDQRSTANALGLRKVNNTTEIEDNPQVRGMVKKVAHLVKVEEA